MAIAAYQKRLEPYETVVARFCFQLAELYELRKNAGGALTNYKRALDIWKYHESRGETQCKVIENRIEKLEKEEAENAKVEKIGEEVKKVALSEPSTPNPEKEGEKEDEMKKGEEDKTKKAKKKNKKKKRK